jgi:hypothetical protein
MKTDWNAIRSIKYKPETLEILLSDNVCRKVNERCVRLVKKNTEALNELQSVNVPLHDNTHCITVLKKKDLICLLQFLPTHVHPFYYNLQTSNEAVDYVD